MSASILCFGEVLLRLSAPGKQLLLQGGGGLETHVGGAEANVAVALSRWGHTAAVATTLPDNALGQGSRDELRRHGVNTSAIRFRSGRMGLYFLTHGAGQRPAEVLYDRANSAFAREVADHDWNQLLTGMRWLHVSGITPAVSDAAAQAALAAAQAARACGVQVSFDCNFRASLWSGREKHAATVLRSLCAQAHLIFGDDRDISLILGREFDGELTARRRAAAQAAFDAFPSLQWLANTRRDALAEAQELGGTLYTRTQQSDSRKYALNGVVDRIGAGDAFAAGILHGLLTGMEPQATVEFATAACTLKHFIVGDFNLASVGDVERLLAGVATDVRR